MLPRVIFQSKTCEVTTGQRSRSVFVLSVSSSRKEETLVVIYKREQCKLCSPPHYWNKYFVYFERKKGTAQSQQMKHLLSSCPISRALRKQERSKGSCSMPGPADCLSKHPSERYWILGCSPRCSFEWVSLNGHRSAVRFNSSLVM